jgi:hypothetical protein
MRTTKHQQLLVYNARVQRPPANALKCALYRSRSACNEMLGGTEVSHSRVAISLVKNAELPHCVT